MALALLLSGRDRAPAEVLTLRREAAALGVAGVPVTRARAPRPKMTIDEMDEMKEVAALGGVRELAALLTLPTALPN